MKGVKVLVISGILSVFSSCFKQEVVISAMVESDRNGNSTIKWEVYPEVNEENSTIEERMVEIYASNNDSVFPLIPIKKVDVNNFIAVIEDADSLNYRYFKLKIGNTYSDVIAKRFYRFNEIQNFRDIGGYVTNDGKVTKWGKIFRAGDFSQADEEDLERLADMNLKSVIDFRPKASQKIRKDRISVPYRYEIYMAGIYNDSITAKILNNSFSPDDALTYMQNIYESMLMQQTDRYAEFFDILLDSDNYPLVYHCSLGKDQSGLMTFFLLKALDVPMETIERDYMLSLRGINRWKIVKDASKLTDSQDQAFIMLTQTDVSYLRYALACVRKTHGSVDDFMTDELGLTQEKRKKLQKLLLY